MELHLHCTIIKKFCQEEWRKMRKRVNMCCGCATSADPCRGARCPLISVDVMRCKECGDVIYKEIDGEEICFSCYYDKGGFEA